MRVLRNVPTKQNARIRDTHVYCPETHLTHVENMQRASHRLLRHRKYHFLHFDCLKWFATHVLEQGRIENENLGDMKPIGLRLHIVIIWRKWVGVYETIGFHHPILM